VAASALFTSISDFLGNLDQFQQDLIRLITPISDWLISLGFDRVDLNAQIDAGAQAVMVFDSWGGVLEHRAFQHFSLAYTQRVLGQLRRTHDGVRVPCIVFTKGGGLWLEQIAAASADVVGLDWTCDLGAARRQVDDEVALQGNLDPMVLFASPEAVATEARAVLDSFGSPRRPDGRWGGHIFNLGHGINQHTPPDNVQALVDTVHAHSQRLRAAP